jgi:hypothetical protein
MGVTLFTANRLGCMVLDRLAEKNFFPDVVTYVRGFQRTSLSEDFGRYRQDFRLTFVAANTADQCENLPDLTDRTVVCVDWTKDFFKDYEGDVIYAHPSLLPAYRGYSAVTEQFIRGVVRSGASFYRNSGRTDGGDILFSKEIPIGFDDYPMDFFEKYASVCADFITDINRRGLSAYQAKPQDEEQAFYLQRKRGKDSIMDFNRDAFSLYNHVRGYSRPFFGAYFMYGGEKVTVWRAKTENWQGDYGVPGTLLGVDGNGAEIACGSGTIILEEIQISDRIFKGDGIPLAVGGNILQ